jgi:RAS protein activator-like 2
LKTFSFVPERDEWIASLKKTLMMNEDRRRTDNSLKIDVLEVKGLSEKKKYYAEILVDDKLYARTSAKKLAASDSCCFWGEQFEFKDLPQNADKISLLIHKESSSAKTSITGGGGKRKKAKKPVGRVKISIQSVKSRYVQVIFSLSYMTFSIYMDFIFPSPL